MQKHNITTRNQGKREHIHSAFSTTLLLRASTTPEGAFERSFQLSPVSKSFRDAANLDRKALPGLVHVEFEAGLGNRTTGRTAAILPPRTRAAFPLRIARERNNRQL
jgi:hypothetical protein